MLTYLCNKAVQ